MSEILGGGGGGGGGTTPGGANTDVQFNNAGTFGGNAGFTYDGLAGISLGQATETGFINLVGKISGVVKLSVQDAAGTDTFKLPNSQPAGASGYFLTSDTSGNWSWAIPTSGTGRTKLTGATTFYCRKLLGTVTITAANPAVATLTAHGLAAGNAVVFSLPLDRQAVSMTHATPCVVTTQGVLPGSPVPTAHGFAAGDPVVFYSSGTLPAGVTNGTTYYVTSDGNLAATTFAFSDTQAHALAGIGQIASTGVQSGNCSVERNSVLNSNIVDSNSVSDGSVFYVLAAGLTANTFEFSTTVSGTPVNAAGAATATAGRVTASTGSDSNNGLTAGASFLTLNGAWNAISAYDFAGFNAILQLAFDTSYNAFGQISTITSWIGNGSLTIQGDISQVGPNVNGYSQDRCHVYGGWAFEELQSGAVTIQAVRNSAWSGFGYTYDLANIGPEGFTSQWVSYAGPWISILIGTSCNYSSAGYEHFVQFTAEFPYEGGYGCSMSLQNALDIYGNSTTYSDLYIDVNQFCNVGAGQTLVGNNVSLPGNYFAQPAIASSVYNGGFEPTGTSGIVSTISPGWYGLDPGSPAAGNGSGYLNVVPGATADGLYDSQTLTSGFSYQIKRFTGNLLVTGAGALSSGTLIMPPLPQDGQLLWVQAAVDLSLTFSGQVGQTLLNPPSFMARGTFTTARYLQPSQTWRFSTPPPGLIPVTAPTTWYVNVATGNDANNGFTTGTAFKTIQAAVDSVSKKYFFQSGSSGTIQVADGTYVECLYLGPWFGEVLPGDNLFQYLTIKGNTTTPDNVIVGGGNFPGGGGGVADYIWSVFAPGAKWAITGFTNPLTSAALIGYFFASQGAFLAFDSCHFKVPTDVGFWVIANIEADTTCFDGTDNFAWTVTKGAATATLNLAIVQNMSIFQHVAVITFSDAATWSPLYTASQGSQLALTQGSPVNPANVNGTIYQATGVSNIIDEIGLAWSSATLIDPGTDGTSAISAGATPAPGAFFGHSISGLPTTTNLNLFGSYGVFKDTVGGGVYLAYNDTGAVKKVQLV